MVAQRRSEIGIRVALAVAGAGLGVAGALAVGGVLERLLFGVAPRDPATIVAGGVLVVAVSLAASALPAWRAVQVDPVAALRAE